MTLIDKAEALLPCPFCGGEAEWKSGGPGCAWISCKSCPAETSDGSIPRIMEAWNRRAALPARGVGVKPLVWQFEQEDVQVANTSARHQYRVIHDRRATKGAWSWFCDGAWIGCETEEAAKAAAQADYEARIIAALEPAALDPTDAAHVNETPKSEHYAGNVLTAAQALAPFFFDRYINGVRMAEGVCIERETTLEGAMQVAARIAANGPNGEAPVLVYCAPAAQAREAALMEAHKAILAMDTKKDEDLNYNLAVLRAAERVRRLINEART